MTTPALDIRTALVRLIEVAEATADSFNIGLMNDAIDAATAALDAEPSENVPIPDHASMLAFACGREPWVTWLKSGGSLESAHLELSDLMLAVLARWGHSAPQAPMSEEMQGLVIDLNEVSSILGTRWPRLSTSLIRAADVLQQQSAALATLRIAHEADQGKVEETVDALVKAEAILADVVEGESPVDNSCWNAHNYFAEQSGHLETNLKSVKNS